MNDAHKAVFPSPFHLKEPFQKLLILRCIRPDKMALAITDFVIEKMTQKYVIPPPFNLQDCFEQSNSTSPLIFVLSAGSDPMGNIMKFSEQHGTEMASISLGQGQGPKGNIDGVCGGTGCGTGYAFWLWYFGCGTACGATCNLIVMDCEL